MHKPNTFYGILLYIVGMITSNMAKKRVTFSLSPDAIKLLKEIAIEEKRSQSNMIEILIYERMKKKQSSVENERH